MASLFMCWFRLLYCLTDQRAKRASVFFICAVTWENVHSGICVQRRLRSACASAQSDQSLLVLRKTLCILGFPKMSPVMILIRLQMCIQSESSLGALDHYENTPIQINWKFHHQKLKFFRYTFCYFSYFSSKHILWVLVRTASSRRF